jgi:hypothetical protein
MERLFCTFFSWTYIYIGNCMYIFKYCYCVIVIHFVNLSWIHDLVAVMKPITERSCLLWDCVWDQIIFDRIMRSLSFIINVVKNIFYVLKGPCSFATVVTSASSMFLPIIPSGQLMCCLLAISQSVGCHLTVSLHDSLCDFSIPHPCWWHQYFISEGESFMNERWSYNYIHERNHL